MSKVHRRLRHVRVPASDPIPDAGQNCLALVALTALVEYGQTTRQKARKFFQLVELLPLQ